MQLECWGVALGVTRGVMAQLRLSGKSSFASVLRGGLFCDEIVMFCRSVHIDAGSLAENLFSSFTE